MTTWTDAQMASIHKMLNPRSIAVVGATPRMQYGGRFLKRVLAFQDRVTVYPVNPKYGEIMGERCYASIAELPAAPDVAAVVVPYHAVLRTLEECRDKGVGSAIVISAGFSERGEAERRALQDRVGAYAQASGVRISGPNCLGLANVRDNLWLTSSSRAEAGIPGPVGLVCQSGASLFGPFLARAMDMGLGMSYVVSTGNEADLEFADFARYLLDDEGTRVIAGFVEGFKDGAKFIEVAKLAQERGKPIVLIKIGRSEQGTRAASSHTAALTGSDRLYDAVCRQYGVVRVQNYDELLETAQLLARARRPLARGVAVVSHSGGVNSLTADMVGQEKLWLPELTQAAKDGIDAILGGFGSAANPADVTGKANSGDFPAIMQHLIAEPEVGTLVIATAGGDAQAEQVLQLRDRSDKNLVQLWTGSRNQPAGLPKLRAAGMPVFYNPDALGRGLRHLFDYHASRDRRTADPVPDVRPATPEQLGQVAALLADGRITLSETESKALIAAIGIPVSTDRRAQSSEEAVKAAERIGYPVVMKIDSPDIPHKTEAGGVRLGLRDAAEVSAAFEDIMANARAYAPGAKLGGVMVQEMVLNGVETIIGVTYDDQLGPTLLFGSGGVTVEVYGDVTLRHCPIGLADAREMIAEVKGSKRLAGFRGSPPADTEALADVLVRVSELAVRLQGRLEELDINPLLVLPKGQGVKAVDALAKFSPV